MSAKRKVVTKNAPAKRAVKPREKKAPKAASPKKPLEELHFSVQGGCCDTGCCMTLTLTRADSEPLTVEDALIFATELLPNVLKTKGLPGKKPEMVRNAFPNQHGSPAGAH